MAVSAWKVAASCGVPARVVKGDSSEASWPCWAAVQAAVVQAVAAGVWAAAGVASANAAPRPQANCLMIPPNVPILSAAR